MAEEGMYYFFEQEEHQEMVVVVDANESCPEQKTMGYDGDAQSEEEEQQYDNSFSTLGQTYTDVTPRPTVSEEPKIEFVWPEETHHLFSIRLGANIEQFCICNGCSSQNMGVHV